jgi:hypothetical protein
MIHLLASIVVFFFCWYRTGGMYLRHIMTAAKKENRKKTRDVRSDAGNSNGCKEAGVDWDRLTNVRKLTVGGINRVKRLFATGNTKLTFTGRGYCRGGHGVAGRGGAGRSAAVATIAIATAITATAVTMAVSIAIATSWTKGCRVRRLVERAPKPFLF